MLLLAGHPGYYWFYFTEEQQHNKLNWNIMKNFLTFLLIIFLGIFLFVGYSQDVNAQNNPTVSKKEVCLKVVDKRVNTFIVGDQPVGNFVIQAMSPRMKIKDKYSVAFPLVDALFKEDFQKEGFLINEPSQYFLQVELDELYFKYNDKFTHIQIDQNCFVTVKLIKADESSPLYEKKFFGVYSCSKADLKMIGYKVNFKNLKFLTVSTRDAIKKTLEDESFKALFSSQ
jgi:hypothetical protein